MYLSNIKIWNFRKYGSSAPIDEHSPNIDLNFNKGLNVLIWENDSWKTAIIDAIKLVLKTNTGDWIKIDKEEDFYTWTDKIRIELRFEWLEIKQARHFIEFLSVEWEWDNTKEYLIIFCEITKNTERVFLFDVKAWPSWSLGILSAEQRELLGVTYLKPLRDVKSEFIPKKWSRLSTILESHEAFKWKWDTHILMGIFNDFNISIENYFQWLDKDGIELSDVKWKELKDKIDVFIGQFLRKWDEWIFWVNPWELKNILEKLELTLKNNINPWLWTLNRLFIASELLHLQRSNYDGLELWLIEEIEAHIHPQAQMKVIESLQKKIEENGTQLILTTHSPNLASKLKLQNLIICCNNNAFPMWKGYTKLDEDRMDDNYRFLERFLDTTKSNLFFSDWVMLVEWWAEEIIIPTFARLLKKLWVITKDLTEAQVSIVNVWNDTFFRYAKVFQRRAEPYMKKNVAIITDLDLRPVEYKDIINVTGKSTEEQTVIWKSKNIISEYTSLEITVEKDKKITNNDLTQWIQTFVSPEWTLEYCLWLFPNFQKLLFKSILYSFRDIQNYSQSTKIEELRKFTEDDFDSNFISLWINDTKKAFSLYAQMLWEKQVAWMTKVEISKTIVAQYFAEFLDAEINKIDSAVSIFTKEDFENISSISYLVNAIKHAIWE